MIIDSKSTLRERIAHPGCKILEVSQKNRELFQRQSTFGDGDTGHSTNNISIRKTLRRKFKFLRIISD